MPNKYWNGVLSKSGGGLGSDDQPQQRVCGKSSNGVLAPQFDFGEGHGLRDMETYKFLWRLPDQSLVESVLICSGERRTVCVSSQVNCPAKCAFCASGKKGFFRISSLLRSLSRLFKSTIGLRTKGKRYPTLSIWGWENR